MTKLNSLLHIPLISLLIMLAAVSAAAQHPRSIDRPLAANLILPQSSSWGIHGTAAVIERVIVEVSIVDQLATTRLDVCLFNPGASRVEAEILLPVPIGSVVRGFDFQGAAAEPTARLLPRDEARRTYEEIVAKVRDPAILEFIGYNLIRSSVFPVEPRGKQRVRLVYEQLLPREGTRIDYLLPRTDSVEYAVPWDISVTLKSAHPISTVYCPTHEVQTTRVGQNELHLGVLPGAGAQPGTFCLSYLTGGEAPAASLIAYPDPSIGGGYFLFLVGFPVSENDRHSPALRQITMVLDRSGSMKGPKLEQVRQASLRILEGLRDGESFNFIAYNEAVDAFSAVPVRKTESSLQAARSYLQTLSAQGGTNIYDALSEALRATAEPGFLPMVLFLTDGTPTVGRTRETDIRQLATAGNPGHRRIFTFGVGSNVNAPLLDALATESRGSATYALEGEDVGHKVTQVFRRLSGPVFSDIGVRITDPRHGNAPARFSQLIPARLADLFAGDQLILLGQYRGEAPLNFEVNGNLFGRPRTFTFSFDLSSASSRHAFVPRLWASRKIGLLIDSIRQRGADLESVSTGSLPRDPETRELVDEIVRLSLKFGILTEYTAFLALEGTDLRQSPAVFNELSRQLEEKAVKTRVGKAAAVQAGNLGVMTRQKTLNTKNSYRDSDGREVQLNSVQQVADNAFYRRENRWVDSRLAGRASTPKRVVRVGSPELVQLAERLARENRQGVLSMRGEILVEIDGETVLVQ